jgi:adenylate kinase
MEDPYKNIDQIKSWLGSGSINFFGLPFSGKDTQCTKLAELLNAKVVGGGDILRASTIPGRVKELMKIGELIPTKDYIEIVLPFLSKAELEGKPLVLSSVGRWHGEEQGVINATAAADHPIRAVFYLDISESEARRRRVAMTKSPERGTREDDKAHAFEVRLQEFRSKTLPVIDYYQSIGILTKIDGNLDRNQVTTKILQSLLKLSVKD